MSQASAPPTATPASRSASSRTSDMPPVRADGPEAARRADNGIAPAETVARHPLVTEREVVLHRIRGVERGEPAGDLGHHPPVPGAPAGQADRAAHVFHVRV